MEEILCQEETLKHSCSLVDALCCNQETDSPGSAGIITKESESSLVNEDILKRLRASIRQTRDGEERTQQGWKYNHRYMKQQPESPRGMTNHFLRKKHP